MRTNLLFRLSIVCLWATGVAWAGTPVIARFADPRPIVLAHRGCWKITAENAVSGLKACAGLGVDIVEVDIRVTNDGELVLMHDDTMDRMTNLSGRVKDLTLAQFKTARLRRADGGKNAPVTDESPPTFVEELRAAKGNVSLFLDIKVSSATEQIYRTIEREGAQDWVVFGANAAELQKMPAWVARRAILSAVECGVAGITSGCFSTLAQAVDAYRPLHPLALGVIFRSDNFVKGGAAAAAAIGTRLQVWQAPEFAAGRDEANPVSGGGKVWGEFLNLGLNVIGTNDASGLVAYLKSLVPL